MSAGEHWRAACGQAISGGERFCGLYATTRGGTSQVRALFARGAQTRALDCPADDGVVPTIVDLIPAAAWDEREAHDLHGLRFDGHEPLRPLVMHPDEPGAWVTPVEGEGVYDVAVGPIHAGVIESGHFRFHVVGERILALDLRLFYKHRGLERAAEGLALGEALPYARRACGACAVSNSVAYAHACEEALGLWPDRDCSRARSLLIELERLWNHLNDISAICAGVGFAPGNMLFASLKERAMRLNERISASRFLFGTVETGSSAFSLPEPAADELRGDLRELATDAGRAAREVAFAGSLQARLDGVGALTAERARRLGCVGPVARAAGIRHDLRSESPRLAYPDDFTPAAPAVETGDVAGRLELRIAELEATFWLLDEFLIASISPGRAQPRDEPKELGVGRVESPRGETVCAVEPVDGRVARVHLRTSSYANWPALAEAVRGNILPDFPLINKSFELCYACVDR